MSPEGNDILRPPPYDFGKLAKAFNNMFTLIGVGDHQMVPTCNGHF